MAEETGKRIGDYEILGVLGSGGMGQVFKVRNVISDRVEAMKILLPDLAGRQDLADRFLREIKVLAALNHPNIAALRTALTLGNQLVMVMEYVEGTSLATRLERGPIAPTDALNYVDQVLSALSYAHQRQVIHRDIKPANMMLTPDGVVKLMDFGIARTATDRALTATGTTLGSMYYMSPEQVKGQPTDARSDLYSLGVALYEMVTGQRPFKGDSDYSLMAAQVQQQPRPPIELRSDLPAALNEIILLAMAKEPSQRFQSADAFRKALGSVRGQMEKSGALVAGTPTATSAPIATGPFQGTTAPASPAYALPTTSAPVTVQPDLTSQPQPVPSVLELSAQQKTHRGLYMTLGALIVLAVLVVAGIYVPRRNKTRADEAAQQAAANQSSASSKSPSSDSSGANATQNANSTAPQDATAAPTASTPDSTANPAPPADATAATSPADSSASAPQPSNPPAGDTAKAGEPQPKKSKNKSGGSASQDNASSQASQAAAQQEQMEQLEKEVDQLSSRTGAVNDSLDNMRRQQAADGFGLRGDIASTQESLKIHMSKAQQALQNQDAKSAKRYLDLAEPEIEKLEKFLGR